MRKTIINETSRFKVYELQKLIDTKKYIFYKEETYVKNWDTKKKSELIESLLLNIPVPMIKLNEYEYSKYEILDGREIVKTILEFLSDDFKLEGLKYLKELNGLTYFSLPEREKDYIYLKNISCINILDADKDLTEEIFERFHQ